MRVRLSSVAVAVVCILASCTPKTDEEQKPSGEAGNGGSDAGNKPGQDAGLDPTSGTKVSVSGLVLDVTGNRIAGADVKLGQRAVKSGANGDFSFGMVTVSEQEVLLVSHAGFAEGRVVLKPMAGAASYSKVTLQAAEQVMLMNPSAGGELTTQSGAVLTLPPNAVVDENGNAVSGPVAVNIALINDRDEMAAAPPMVATDPGAASDAPAAELESFGMVSIDLSANGVPVHLASGASVEVAFPMSAGSHFITGEPVGLWHFDETEQLWKSDGEGTVDSNNMFHAVVSHFSWWNADQVLTKTCVRSRVFDAAGQPVPGANVNSEGRSYLGSTHATTDMQGNFCIEARVGSVIELNTLVRVGDANQALAVHVNTPRTTATCGRPADCYELPAPLVAVADQPLCQPSQCPQDPAGVKQACCLTDLGPCNFVVNGDCGGSEDGAWDVPSETPGVMQIPGVPMSMLPDTSDAGLDASVQPEPDAATPEAGTPDAATPDAGTPDSGTADSGTVDAGIDSGTAQPDAAVCGPFFQSACKTCIASQCGEQAGTCFGQQWQQGSFEGQCQSFIQCLCSSPSGDPSGCDAQGESGSCPSCIVPLDVCMKANCSELCGGDGNGGEDGGTHEGAVDRCADVQALATLDTVNGTTVDSTLRNDWYDNGACQNSIPGRGYLPGYERSYSVVVPAGLTLRAHVEGAGMLVMIADECTDINGRCRSAGDTASFENDTQSSRTVYVTVDNVTIDAQGAFSLYLSTATPACGDRFLDDEEACDDGATTAGDGCDATCGIEQGWSCPGDLPCHEVVCGDGIRESGARSTGYEPCDDGNVVNSDGCSASCQVEPYYVCEQQNTPCRAVECGDGLVDRQFEECDDSNPDAGDGCSASCEVETGWSCGKNGTTCVETICGDGALGPPETCDDGNDEPGDGCNANCQYEAGWVCNQPGAPCREVVCGDGNVDFPDEDCEDGNTDPDDGCSPACVAEPGYLCNNSGQNCTQHPAGDLCNNADALPSGSFSGSYSLEGMSADQINCDYCAVTRWFSVVQQPGEVTVVRVEADFQGGLGFVAGSCPVWQSGAGSGGGFSPEQPQTSHYQNETDEVRTLYFAIGGYLASGTFDLAVKTGEPGCGDGVRGLSGSGEMSSYEECDDFNTVSGDGCSATCHVEPGYHCDYDGPCVASVCGDGHVDYVHFNTDEIGSSEGEQCDDGNTEAGDGCSATCTLEPGAACGMEGSGSACHLTPEGDECTNALALPLGNSSHSLEGFSGAAHCQLWCGGAADVWFTRVIQPREVLDVQATADFAGRVHILSSAPSGCFGVHDVDNDGVDLDETGSAHARNDGIVPLTLFVVVRSLGAEVGEFSLDVSVSTPAQDCDQGPCEDVTCGDGQINGTEQCDDGDTVDGDGCSATCVRELGYSCSGQGSGCTPMEAGDTCEIAQTLAAGDYDFEGYTPDWSCDVSCSGSDQTRWFQVVVPESQSLLLSVTSDEAAGEVTLFDATQGDCDHLGSARLISIPYGAYHFGYGGWINRSGAPRTILIGIANEHDASSSFTLQYSLGATGCGDAWTDATGYFGAVEACDDGNTVSGDGCSATCEAEQGWDCQRGSCTLIVCGDGIKSSTEGCDDANTVDSDGCAADCTVEEGYLCGGQPSLCQVTPPGDRCVSALALVDDSYSMTGFLPDLDCAFGMCSNGIDRWFTISVPAGQTLSVFGTGDMDQGSLRLLALGQAGCSEQMQVNQQSLGGYGGTRGLFFTNPSAVDQLAAVVVSDESSVESSDANFTLTHALRPAGCGDFFLNEGDQGGGTEQCDDGNTNSGDGCSSSCQIEQGYACYGQPLHCVIPPPGDVCETAQPLEADSYGLTGYLPDAACDIICDGPDRWLTMTVPPHMLLNLEISTDSAHGSAALYSRTGTGCSNLVSLNGESFQSDEPHSMRWHNDSEEAVDVMLALYERMSESSDASFDVSYRMAVPGCGDGYADMGQEYGPFENCDDGNQVAGDGCSDSCQTEFGYNCLGSPSVCTATCGDNEVAPNEDCDDGNLAADDGCSPTCTVETGYDCVGVSSNCQPVCGDGLLRGNEECDDSNTTNADGCSASCSIEAGWTCGGEPTVCSATCGDGVQVGTEECDDGNTMANDGCSPTCTNEP